MKNNNKDIISFSPITLKEDYRKKFNITSNDFIVLTDKNGNQVNDSLYRKGGSFNYDPTKDKYLTLLKQVESKYPRNIMDMCKGNKNPNHLQNTHCIVDWHGNEKFLAENGFEYITIIRNSCLFIYKKRIYNIETLFCYGQYDTSIDTEMSLIVEVRENYSSPKTVIKINKLTGDFEKID